ncbi:PREDICTED: uncharacterized protein LOC105360970 [Ceratosolen solmsi marchali]|uniref:Uncharacterized protein LOC105360970 n=1 Tax=Ceratosolen solmsi marchali TaxID=326594 RepID=A0AAJ7DTU1_9HYME|nr:PREDICTED: uncharacterized protein LOC105360970 [Ceratosolen solmsi marchali]
MEIMEDGNLVDRVRILLQRDMQYYQDMQTVLREPLCIRVCGGKFDFPRHASFAAIKIVIWWEAEFMAAFKRPSGLSSGNQDNVENDNDSGVVKKTLPSEFILLVVETSEQLLEHLHTLIQESLDHADLTVLTATLGAAALIRNCLWCYNQQTKNEIHEASSSKLHKCYKSFNEMAEAVAERLLDLHCRLISLYILNEADSLNWQSNQPFCEKERCSYVIQMWWLYMQGTKTDLWNTVSPKMAQRIFSGILNESLSIIVARFIHGRPSLARSMQFWADAFNVLCCTAYLSLGICTSGNEMIGLNVNKLSPYIRDIHAKCNELLTCFLLRGAPLKILFQVFRKGLDNLTISKRGSGPSPWLYVCSPNLLGISHAKCERFQNLTENQAVILELNVLTSQPQPNWIQIMKVLSMNDYELSKLLLTILIRQTKGERCIGGIAALKLGFTEAKTEKMTNEKEQHNCGGFLCMKNSCRRIMKITPAMGLYSLTFILLHTGCDVLRVFVSSIKQDPTWSSYLDRQQVWNQARPPWLNALLDFLQPIMGPIVDTLLDAIKTGASIYQAMSLALACLGELHECLPLGVLQTALAMDENVPAHCRPIGGSVLLQVMCSALYTALINVSVDATDSTAQHNVEHQQLQSEVRLRELEISSFNSQNKSASAIALSEALCSIDEDNKHTTQIDDLLDIVRKSVERRKAAVNLPEIEDVMCIIESYADELSFTDIGRSSLKIIYEYLLRTSKVLLDMLKHHKKIQDSHVTALNSVPSKSLTHTMFHIGETAFDRLLVNYEDIDWQLMFEIPMSIPSQRVRAQVLSRSELINILQLEQEEREAANFIKQLCTSGVLTRRN